MKVVIDISKEDYELMKYTTVKSGAKRDGDYMRRLILNGTPLPKGHGRLIDADELKTMSYEVFVDADNPNRADGLSACNGLVEDDIELAPTIIKAEGEDEND